MCNCRLAESVSLPRSAGERAQRMLETMTRGGKSNAENKKRELAMILMMVMVCSVFGGGGITAFAADTGGPGMESGAPIIDEVKNCAMHS